MGTYLFSRVTKRIDLPSNSWLNSELLEHPILTIHHVVNHIRICGTRLIVHGPPGIEKLNLSILDKLFDLLSLFWSLLVIPLLEEGHFALGEFSLWILE